MPLQIVREGWFLPFDIGLVVSAHHALTGSLACFWRPCPVPRVSLPLVFPSPSQRVAAPALESDLLNYRSVSHANAAASPSHFTSPPSRSPVTKTACVHPCSELVRRPCCSPLILPVNHASSDCVNSGSQHVSQICDITPPSSHSQAPNAPTLTHLSQNKMRNTENPRT
eukprot:2278130-Rhodomonas_salina.1